MVENRKECHNCKAIKLCRKETFTDSYDGNKIKTSRYGSCGCGKRRGLCGMPKSHIPEGVNCKTCGCQMTDLMNKDTIKRLRPMNRRIMSLLRYRPRWFNEICRIIYRPRYSDETRRTKQQREDVAISLIYLEETGKIKSAMKQSSFETHRRWVRE